MWPLQQQWFFSISWERAGTCRTTRPSPGPQSTRAHEAVRENADMERHPHGSLISAQLCLSVARRGMHQSFRQHLAHFVPLEHTGFLRSVAERHRPKPAGRPAQPAFPRLSTASIYIGSSGRRSRYVGCRGSAAVWPGRSLAVFLVHRRTDGPEEKPPAVGLCRFVPGRSAVVKRLALPRAVAPSRTTRANPMPPHLTQHAADSLRSPLMPAVRPRLQI